MDVILSINPKYVSRIQEGVKKYEFRKARISIDEESLIFIYATSPVMKLVGYFRAKRCIHAEPREIWAGVSDEAGLTEAEFLQYYGGRKRGFAIEIKDTFFFDDPIDPYSILPAFKAPQSFVYVDRASLGIATITHEPGASLGAPLPNHLELAAPKTELTANPGILEP